MIQEYNQNVIKRTKLDIPPKSINVQQITNWIKLLKNPIIKNKNIY